MQCTIPSKYIKLFAKSIQCLAKVGEDLYIHATRKELVLRTLNSSRVAFFAFFLNQKFFDHYELDENNERKFAVKLKSCQAVFRQFDTVEQCELRLDDVEDRFVFTLTCKHGIRKVYKLTYEEVDPVLALYNKDEATNTMQFHSKKMLEAVSNFQNSNTEISLFVAKNAITLQSHSEETVTQQKTRELKTKLTLDVADFEGFHVGLDTSITFCMKEFKAMLAFGDAAGQPLKMSFERGGRPLLITTNYFDLFSADFVLATLIDNSSQSGDSSRDTDTKSTPNSNGCSNITPQSSKRSSYLSPEPTTPLSRRELLSEVASPSPYVQRYSGDSAYSSGGPIVSSSPSVITSGSNSIRPDSPQQQYHPSSVNGTYNNVYQGYDDDDDEVPPSPPPDERPNKVQRREDGYRSHVPMDEEDDDDEEVPSSAPQ
ncbi:RAD9 like protein [Planoprotostelium fungivorum]|uniref:Cell cycle checkpoint control protein RAD9A n=1 Tax=Planoprotostelium fungivorum TaxID=1890364 RepID=A0A2P6MQJ3_9EUKA|nr:RAD9 like protein [Planoprotostelium fungivorum]